MADEWKCDGWLALYSALSMGEPSADGWKPRSECSAFWGTTGLSGRARAICDVIAALDMEATFLARTGACARPPGVDAGFEILAHLLLSLTDSPYAN
jgi:hypothetical protein